MPGARRTAAVLFGCALVLGCGGRHTGEVAEPIRNQLPPPEPVIPGEPAVAAPVPPLTLPPLGMDITLDVTFNGDVYIGSRRVRDAELDGVLLRLHAADPARGLVIRANGLAGHRVVMTLLQRARAAGFTRFSVATDPVRGPRPPVPLPEENGAAPVWWW